MLVGRERHLGVLRRSRVAVITGEPGIGKTALLRAACGEAARDGYRVFRGTGWAAERHVPYGLFLDALGPIPEARGARVEVVRRTPVAQAAAWVRQALAGRALLALDDLRWADDRSLALLHELLRDPPCRVLLTDRSHAASRLGASAGELLRVESLTVAEAAAMGCDAETHTRALGVPFYLELLRDGSDLSAAVEPELADLSPTELRVLQAAAVAGPAFDAALVAEIAAVAEATTLTSLDTLKKLDLVRPAAPLWQHRHPLFRDAVHDGSRPGWRLGAHARALAVLERRDAPAAERAEHVERAAGVAAERAAAILTAAAEEAATDPPQAARRLESALRYLPSAELEVRLAEALTRSGRLREARDRLHHAIGRLPAGPSRTRAVELRATVERLLGHHTETLALLAAEPEPTLALRVEAAAAQLMGCLHQAPWPLDDPLPQDDPELLASARALRVLNDAAHGTVTNSPLPEPPGGRADTLLWTGVAALQLDRQLEADSLLRRAAELANRTGERHLISHIRHFAGLAKLRLGDLDAASAAFAESLEAARATGSPDLVCMALAGKAQAMAWRGEAAPAAALAEEAVAAAGGRRSLPASLAVGMVALTRRLLGDPAGCADLLVSWGGGPDLPAFGLLHRVDWLAVLAGSFASADRPAEAKAAADHALELAKGLGLPRMLDLAGFARACALKATTPAWSATIALEVAESFERRGDTLYAAWARILAGSALADTGDVAAGRTELEYGRSLAAAGGARTLNEAAARELRRTGTPAVPLTDRELQISGLVSGGLTNKQIARRLFLSPRTIEAALTRIFGKLGVSSRAGVAAALSSERSA